MCGRRADVPSRRPEPDAGGFTLVEVIVALAGAGLLLGALASVLWTQTRFQVSNDDAILTDQTARAISDGMAAELRGGGPGDLLTAAPDSVSLRFDVLRAVVCETHQGGLVDLFAYDSVLAPNVPRGFRGTAYSGPYDANFNYADGFTPVSSVSGAAEAVCRANGADPTGSAPRSSFRRTSGWSGPFTTPPIRGSVARIYGSLTYSLAPSATRPGTLALRRNGQEYATPLATGARFEYEMADGTTRASVGTGNLIDVREVRLVATTVGRSRGGAARSLVYEVPLRN